ncbi:hypothetical protein LMG28688_01203 [Paraburkholderia caffeinitolerans]|uniref:Uncharacterized protein n=1 Tax=Paraburkholderia caffeinitolerans TaxID=1723730 RepID=A0A6J5FJZ7_9BURK|nr:hypothetical protein LMG28688_01203 [Paraburkholderia caffeinitolerans]
MSANAWRRVSVEKPAGGVASVAPFAAVAGLRRASASWPSRSQPAGAVGSERAHAAAGLGSGDAKSGSVRHGEALPRVPPCAANAPSVFRAVALAVALATPAALAPAVVAARLPGICGRHTVGRLRRAPSSGSAKPPAPGVPLALLEPMPGAVPEDVLLPSPRPLPRPLASLPRFPKPLSPFEPERAAPCGCAASCLDARRLRRSSSSGLDGRILSPRPSETSAHAKKSRQRKSMSQGRLTNSSAAIASGAAVCPISLPSPPASACPSASKPSMFRSVASSVQLASSTQTKPSQSRIVPGPRKPAPPGSTDFTRRQIRGTNQMADKPNQPGTTVCMPEINA